MDEMGIFDTKEGEELYKETAKKWSVIIGNQIGEKVSLNLPILLECYSNGQKSSKAHGQENLSNFKEAGHICYWIKKLKPFRVDVRKEYLKRFTKECIDVFSKFPGVEDELKLIEETLSLPDANNDVERFHINEYVALFTSLEIIQLGQTAKAKILEQEGETEKANDRRKRLELNYKRAEKKAKLLTHSLRYHSHTSLTMATKFEWNFS